ncbi:MAG: 30S ribosomal protein S6 [Chloroflexi bacterium]|nr:30S ribosomal protein S6 [Chloroflexota bacterium]
MRTYELVTIFSPMLDQEQAAEAWGRVKDFITSRDAEITREQSWGTRRLAYPIRKGSINFLEGSYYLTQFATERPFNFDLETFLRRDERVLRSLVTVADPDAPIAQPGMAAAAARAAAVEAAAAAEVAAAAAAEADAIAAAEAEPATEESVAEAEPIAEAEPAVEEPVAEVDPVEVDPVEVEPVSEPESQSEEERSES